MSQAARVIEADVPSSGTQLVAIETIKAAELFVPGAVAKLIAKVELDVRAIALDASTEEGRKEIKSLAFKVARSKTGLDDLGKDFVAHLKKAAGQVDADRRIIRDRLDALRDEVRKPVDEWEAKEEKRVADHVAGLDTLVALGQFEGVPTIIEIDARLAAAEVLRSRDWEEFSERAEQLLDKVPGQLKAMRKATVLREAEAAELAQLRAAEAQRQSAEAQRLEAERVAREAQERKEREDKIAAEAAGRAREEAAVAAKAAAEQAERDQAAAVAAERTRMEAAAATEAAETARRAADKEHRRTINAAIVADLVGAASLTEDQAKAVVVAIAGGKVANVTVKY